MPSTSHPPRELCHATAIYLSARLAYLSSPITHRKLFTWLHAWDVHRHKYKLAKQALIITELSHLKPILSYDDLQWYLIAETHLNPLPEEDLWIAISILKSFLAPDQYSPQIIPIMENQEKTEQSVIGANLATQEQLIIESDSFPIPASSLSTPARVSFSSRNSAPQTASQNRLSPQLLSAMDTLLGKA